MNCAACQHENRDTAKFCEECAAPLKRACSACGADLRPTARFCDECAAPVGARPSAEPQTGHGEVGTRKVVTIIFADLAGSTALHERLDAESARRFMESYYRAMRGAVERQGGKVAKLLGDGVMAVFGLPLVAEDDAIRAVRAAVDMQRVFRELAEWHSSLVGKVGLRVAVNTGEVVARDETELIGDPVNVAARLQDQARDGDVVLGEATRRLVSALVTLEPLGSLALKGRAEAVSAYRLVSLERPTSAATAAFVGRDDELARLMAVHHAAISTPAARLTVLVGSPGLGKSRLMAEFVRRASDHASVVMGHCDNAGGTSFAPVTQALRRFLGIDDAAPPAQLRAVVDSAVATSDADRERIVDGVAALLGGSPASPEETFYVIRRLLAALAASRPLVLVIDDLHWAEPLLLDLVEHLVQWGSGVPLFVLAGARPELRDSRSSLTTTGGVVADVVTLAGLDAGAAMRLAANMIGAADLPAAVAAKVLTSSEGNPLFVGELVRMLVHEGALRREGGRWTVGSELAALEMPPTIHALLAARIERLRPEDRAVLERAAVVGRHFSRSAVSALLPRDATDIDARLESLKRSELIEADTGWFLGEPVLRFHHLLIRDAAYRRLLKGTRAELHGKLAEWIEAKTGDAVEYDETIGWHLEQAYLHLRELGPLDDRGRAIGERAAGHLAEAGRRSLARDDLSLAAGLLGRALPCLEPDAASRAELVLDWCEALLAAGDVTTATSAIDELDRLAAASPRLRAWHTCFAGQLTALTSPQALHESADAVAAAAVELASLGDDAGEAKAHSVHAQALARLGRVGACEAALDRALAAARKAGDRRRANAVLAGAPVAALWGPSPVTRASGRCLDVVRVLRITQGAPAVEAVALSCQGVLEALRGRTDAARRMVALSRKMVEELGISHRLFEADVFAGRIDLLEGDAAAAERHLRGAYEGLRDLGLGIDAARAAALLARALLALGRADEAEALSHESEILAGDDLQAAIAWRGVRAEALARRGEHAAAVDLARASVAIAAATDALLDHADARLSLAAALRASGLATQAGEEEKRAIELWEAKGATLLAEQARGSAAKGSILTAETEAGPDRTSVTTSRRVHDNAATRNIAAFTAALAPWNPAAAGDLLADELVIVHHPTGSAYGKAEMLENSGRLVHAAGLSCESVPLAGLGKSLGMARVVVRGDSVEIDNGASFGAFELDTFVVIEVDGQGRRRHAEVFAADRLGLAIARLYELHAAGLPAGPVRHRAQRVALSTRSLLEVKGDWSALAPDVVYHDHRRTGAGERQGPARMIEVFAVMEELASDLVWRIDDIVHLDDNLLALIGTNLGTDRLSGGVFERSVCVMLAFGDDGLLHRLDNFEPEDVAAVHAQLHRMLPAKPAPQLPARPRVRPNAATRNVERFASGINTGEREITTDLYADDVVNVHHPTGVRFDKSSMVESFRAYHEASRPSCEVEILAGFGETLCLARQIVRVEGMTREDTMSFGPLEFAHLVVIEVDAQGRRRRNELFAPDHLEDAVARLYELRAEILPEGPERECAAATARSVRGTLEASADLERFAAMLTPDVAFRDHRLTGVGALTGRAPLIGSLRALEQLTSEMVWRFVDVLHLREFSFAMLGRNTGKDSLGGGDFERRFATVWKFGPDGLVTHLEFFEPEETTRALQRLDELADGDDIPERFTGAVAGADILPLSPYDNLATDSWRALLERWRTPDWENAESQFAEDFLYLDRRRLSQFVLGRKEFVRFTGELASMPSICLEAFTLATRGERQCLLRICLDVAGDDVGTSRIEHLNVVELNAGGIPAALVRFDLDDYEAAFAELVGRFEAGEAMAYPVNTDVMRRYALARDLRDWQAVAALFHPDLATTDHRVLGWGSLQGRDAFLETQRALIDLAPDARHLFHHVRVSRHGYLGALVICGTRDGGYFELPSNTVMEIDEQGLINRVDIYESEDHERALRHFRGVDARRADARPVAARELRTEGGHPVAANRSAAATAPTDAQLQVLPNAATRMHAKLVTNHAARDWEGMRRLAADDFRFEDRSRRVLVDGDVEIWIKSMQFVASHPGVRFVHDALATFGDRILVGKLSWIGESTEAEFLTDKLRLIETSADGRLQRVALFDPDDRAAIFAEALALFGAGEADGAAGLTTYAEFARRLLKFDWMAVRETLAPDFVFDDRRPLSLGILDRGQWIASLQVQADMAPDLASEVVEVLAWNRRGCLLSLRNYGDLRDGGPFENVFLAVMVESQGKLAHVEPHPIDARAEAIARFEELTRDPSGVLPNAASRATLRSMENFDAEDWQAIRDLACAGFVYEDRGRRALVTGDVETWIASVQFILAHFPAKITQTLIATFGEHIELRRLLFSGNADGAAVEWERLRMTEVDENGSISAVILFDPENRAAACLEGLRRFSAREIAEAEPVVALSYAILHHDWQTLRSVLSDNCVINDHRPLSFGIIDREQWIASLVVQEEMAPDFAPEPLRVIAWNRHGVLVLSRICGNLRDGGLFENVLTGIYMTAGQRIVRAEFFTSDQTGKAVARFEELCAARDAPAVG